MGSFAVIGMLAIASGAQASDASVRAAIHEAGSEIKESPELKSALAEAKAEKKSTGKASPAKLISVVSKFRGELKEVAQTVSAQTASSAAGKRGERLWLKGVRKLITGYSDLQIGIEDKEKHAKGKAKEEGLNAAADVVAAAKDLSHADKLLKVKK